MQQDKTNKQTKKRGDIIYVHKLLYGIKGPIILRMFSHVNKFMFSVFPCIQSSVCSTGPGGLLIIIITDHHWSPQIITPYHYHHWSSAPKDIWNLHPGYSCRRPNPSPSRWWFFKRLRIWTWPSLQHLWRIETIKTIHPILKPVQKPWKRKQKPTEALLWGAKTILWGSKTLCRLWSS